MLYCEKILQHLQPKEQGMFGYFIRKQAFSLHLQLKSCRKKEGKEERKKERKVDILLMK
jgi:hypothetical protein